MGGSGIVKLLAVPAVAGLAVAVATWPVVVWTDTPLWARLVTSFTLGLRWGMETRRHRQL